MQTTTLEEVECKTGEETLIDVTLEEEIIVVLLIWIEETIETGETEEMTVVDSEVGEADLDLALLLTTTEDLQGTTVTMTSEDQEERDLDLAAEMDLLTVDTGIEITETDMTEDP
jgi:hypothetical protein